MKQKQLWPDHLRAIATVAVITLHVSAPILVKYNKIELNTWHLGNIFDSLTRFCVPIFFMLSGTLLLKKDYKLKDFLKKRVTRTVPPLIFWSLIYIIYTILNSDKNFNSLFELINYFVRKLFHRSEYHLWFVYTLIGLYLFIPILRKWIKNSSKKEVLFFLIIWCISIFYNVPRIRPYLPKIDLVNFSGYIGYMLLGYYLSDMKPIKKYKSLLIFLSGVLITVLGTYYFTNKNGVFFNYFYGYLTPNVLISSIGAYLLIKELNIKHEFINKIFSLISQYSYGIYLSHILILKLLIHIGISWEIFNPIISIPIITIITISISIFIIHFGKKIKLIANLID